MFFPLEVGMYSVLRSAMMSDRNERAHQAGALREWSGLCSHPGWGWLARSEVACTMPDYLGFLLGFAATEAAGQGGGPCGWGWDGTGPRSH